MKLTKYKFFLLAAVLLTSCNSDVRMLNFRNHILYSVLEFSGRPIPNAGYIGSYSNVKLSDDAGETLILYIPVLTDGQIFPQVGMKCRIKYSNSTIDGYVGERMDRVSGKDVDVADFLYCGNGRVVRKYYPLDNNP